MGPNDAAKKKLYDRTIDYKNVNNCRSLTKEATIFPSVLALIDVTEITKHNDININELNLHTKIAQTATGLQLFVYLYYYSSDNR